MLLSEGDITARTKDGITALSFIVSRTPEVLSQLATRFDQAVSLHYHELGDMDCELRVDFRPLVPLGGRNETDLMLCLVEVGEGHMLKHLLCQSFLYLKWKRIRKFFLLSLLFHLIFVAFFISFIYATYLKHNEQVSSVLFWPILGFTCILASKNLFQITYGICYYIKRWKNWLEWSVIVTSSIILIPPARLWQYHVSALGIFLAWILLMIVIYRFPTFRLFVQMCMRAFINLIKFCIIFVSLITGFALSFQVLINLVVKSYIKIKSDNMDPKMVFSEEKDLKMVFSEDMDPKVVFSEDVDSKVVFSEEYLQWLYKFLEISYAINVIFFGFVILVAVTLIKLKTSLAATDMEKLHRRAGLERLVCHAKVIACFENMLDYTHACKIIQACRKNILLLYPSHDCTLDTLHIRMNDPRDKRLPRELIQSLYRLALEQKIRRWTFYTSSFKNITANKPNHARLSRTYSNDSNQQHLNEIMAELKKCSHNVAELKKCSHDISIRLYSLTNKIENIDRDRDLTIYL
ncbi:Transient receptor potential channel pyrexia [Camponotus floridanus]|uniref:Transient receptor potential channel pyrexia n=1 Tax=Camponotus floridanus TaxID=104421 RepID=E2AV79_CAMFO|nr:Transient receptor potential channel pyrexia [Camponotus floridanus]